MSKRIKSSTHLQSFMLVYYEFHGVASSIYNAQPMSMYYSKLFMQSDKYIACTELLVVTISNDVKGSFHWWTDTFYNRGLDIKLHPYLYSYNSRSWYQEAWKRGILLRASSMILFTKKHFHSSNFLFYCPCSLSKDLTPSTCFFQIAMLVEEAALWRRPPCCFTKESINWFPAFVLTLA